MLVYENADIIVVYDPIVITDTLVVSFSSWEGRSIRDLVKFFYDASIPLRWEIHELGYSGLFVIGKKSDSLFCFGMDEIVAESLPIRNKYSEALIVGLETGALPALSYGKMLKAKSVLAISPRCPKLQTTSPNKGEFLQKWFGRQRRVNDLYLHMTKSKLAEEGSMPVNFLVADKESRVIFETLANLDPDGQHFGNRREYTFGRKRLVDLLEELDSFPLLLAEGGWPDHIQSTLDSIQMQHSIDSEKCSSYILSKLSTLREAKRLGYLTRLNNEYESLRVSLKWAESLEEKLAEINNDAASVEYNRYRQLKRDKANDADISAALKNAVELRPDYFFWRYQLATDHAKAGKMDAAVRELLYALEECVENEFIYDKFLPNFYYLASYWSYKPGKDVDFTDGLLRRGFYRDKKRNELAERVAKTSGRATQRPFWLRRYLMEFFSDR